MGSDFEVSLKIGNHDNIQNRGQPIQDLTQERDIVECSLPPSVSSDAGYHDF